MPRTNAGRPEILGVITESRPEVSLLVVDPPAQLTRVLVDTGFTGSLTVPEGTLLQWGLKGAIETVRVALADGSAAFKPSAVVEVLWLGERKEIRAIELGRGYILGMGLLGGTTIQLEADTVRITRPARRRAKQVV